jgi:hypothetical protein
MRGVVRASRPASAAEGRKVEETANDEAALRTDDAIGGGCSKL